MIGNDERRLDLDWAVWIYSVGYATCCVELKQVGESSGVPMFD